MLFRVFDQLQHNPLDGIVTLSVFGMALVIAITFHEFSHALSATLLNDDTARRHGRLSLNPLAHLDLVGTAMILLTGFGWGKPVQINPINLRIGALRGTAVVSLMGPLSNVLVARVVAIPISANIVNIGFVGFRSFSGNTDDLAGYIVGSVVFCNLLLATFNIIPVAPLDGFKVALGILPKGTALRFARLERYGPAILISIIMIDLLTDMNILINMIRPILNTLAFFVLGGHIW